MPSPRKRPASPNAPPAPNAEILTALGRYDQARVAVKNALKIWQQQGGSSFYVGAGLLDQGKLTLVDNEILQTTGSIRLKAEFPNKAHRLWPGELISVRLLVDTRHNGLTVPASVVQQGQQGAYAYVVDPDGSVTSRQIKVSQISQGQALIDSGLSPNEQVVVDGQYKLQEGTHVTILHGQAADEAAAQSAQQAVIP